MNIEIKFNLDRGASSEYAYIGEFRAVMTGIKTSLNTIDYCAGVHYNKFRNVMSADGKDIIGTWRITP